jgi:hypothetical protein
LNGLFEVTDSGGHLIFHLDPGREDAVPPEEVVHMATRSGLNVEGLSVVVELEVVWMVGEMG